MPRTVQKSRTTRLGKALRDLAVLVVDEHVVQRLETSAAALDRAVFCMGVKGERIKSLGAYIHAARVYQEVAGTPYVPKS